MVDKRSQEIHQLPDCLKGTEAGDLDFYMFIRRFCESGFFRVVRCRNSLEGEPSVWIRRACLAHSLPIGGKYPLLRGCECWPEN